ncbi:MAG TPA: hypothetical protein VG456_13640, partial [Candidatus Sulfopaludibacter sp.]|nr:hypothetical protein [Candidatus Sulfopaludibacter sp.]
RWPDRADCRQECLSQIEAHPKECLVRSILSEWYARKKCIYCRQGFEEIQWAVQKPALLVDGTAVACDLIPAERLLEVLATAKPICFSCHTATEWVKANPDLVTNRTIEKRPDSR